MHAPAEQLFPGDYRRGLDGVMPEAALWHVADPAPDKGIVRTGYAQPAFSGQAPDIHHHCGARADEQGVDQYIHDSLRRLALERSCALVLLPRMTQSAT